MRDRLIKLIKEAKKQTKNANCDIERNMIFADYLLANGVIVPPCKVGDVIYFVNRNSGKPIGNVIEIEIVQVGKSKIDFCGKGRIIGWDDDFEIPHLIIDNYSFYYSKEEAEQALKGGEA